MESRFWTGKIRSVTVNNFITFDSAKVFFGPNLNVICGPNGTGKSSLVAAIVIAMGGSCNTLSRGKKLEDFVKNGKNKAAVAVELYTDEERNVMEFYRSFTTDGVVTWKLNKRKVTQKVYLDAVKQFNIQVDNLCQFLPQDRVQDFAKMNPEEVFLNTVKSVCDSEVFKQLEDLRGLEKNSKASNTELSKWVKELKEAETTNDQLKVRIENMEQRTVLQEKLQVAKIKRSHLLLEEYNAKAAETKCDLDAAKKSVKEHQKKLAPIQNENKDYAQQVDKIDEEISAHHDLIAKLEMDLRTLDHQTDLIESEVRMAKASVEHAIKKKANIDKEVLEETNLLTALLQDLQAATSKQPEFEAKKTALKARIGELGRETKGIERKRHELMETEESDMKPRESHLRRKIEDIQDVEKKHMETLEDRFPDMYKAAMWLRENAQTFRGKVYEPIALELKLKDGREGKYLENVIAIRDLTAIVCEEKEDMKLLVKKLTQEMRLRVNVLQSNAANKINFTPRIPIENLKKFGFTKYILDMVEAPFPILNYLCRIYNLHNIPLGTEYTGRVISDVIKAGAVRLFFTPNHRYSVSKSKYSASSSTTCNEIRTRNILSVPIDQEHLEREQKRLEELLEKREEMKVIIVDCQKKITTNETKMRELNVELKDTEGKIQQIAGLGKRVKYQQQKLKNVKNAVVDVEAEKEKCRITTVESARKTFEVCQKMTDATEKLEQTRDGLMYKQDYLKRYHADNVELKARLCELKMAIEQAQKLEGNIQKTLDGIKRRIGEQKEEIKELIEVHFPANMKYTEHAEFTELPSTDDELLTVVTSLQAQVDCMENRNEKIIKEYELRGKKIEELSEKIATQSGKHKQLEGIIEQLHAKWFPIIDKIIDTINTKFSDFMASMNFAGEIALTRKGEHTYSSYGIAIRVVYRNNETLQQLNSHLQSGGERTVAIATYTMALQQLTKVPFRCVDEINQGMDPKNERKILEMLIAETAKPGMSQYFFITPKLLQDIRTNDHMVFHCVYNGPYVESAVLFIDTTNNDQILSQF